MKNYNSSLTCVIAAALGMVIAGAGSAFAQSINVDVKGGDVTGGSVTGGSTTGGTVTGGSVTGGSVQGGLVQGGSVQGGSVTGGKVTPGNVTSGTVTSGTVTPGSVGAGTATVTVNGREITARVQGSVSIQTDNANAVVNLGSHKVVLEKERVLVDGQERGSLPSSAKKIGLDYANEQLTVRADDKEVLKTELK